MVGSPFQTPEMLVKDLKFIEKLNPEMCGIGPFVPHKDTKFKNENHGDVSLVLMLLSIIRLLKPNILLPATTALGTVDPLGRGKGHSSRCKCCNAQPFPLLSTEKDYSLYDNKICTGDEAAQCIGCLADRMKKKIGYEIVTDRGDYTENYE